MNKYSTSLLAIILTNFLFIYASAGGLQYHSHQDILKTVHQYLDENLQNIKGIEIISEVNSLDSRLKLLKCESPLKAFTASNINQSAAFSVGIKCVGLKPWSLYLSVKVKKIASLYTASIPISRGEVLSELNTVKVKRDINRLRQGFYQHKPDLMGMIAKRSIRAGTIFTSKHLAPPTLIKKGDSVDIIAQSNAISIRMSGKAMSDGAKGQRIPVKNNSSKRIVNAIVTTATTVQVRL